jgi:hypothetical protein
MPDEHSVCAPFVSIIGPWGEVTDKTGNCECTKVLYQRDIETKARRVSVSTSASPRLCQSGILPTDVVFIKQSKDLHRIKGK